MNFGGIIAGAMGEGARAVGNMAQSNIDTENRERLMNIESELQIKRAQALEQYRSQMNDEARTKRAADISQRAQGIIDSERTAGVTAAGMSEARRDAASSAAVSDEQRAAARERAIYEGGYVDPRDEIAQNTRTRSIEAQNARLRDNLSSRERLAADAEAGRNARSDADRGSRERIAELNAEARRDAAAARADHNRGQTPERLTTQLNSLMQLAKRHEEMSPGRTPESRAAWQAKRDDLNAEIDEIRGELKQRRSGGDSSQKDAPKTAPREPMAPRAAESAGGIPAPKSRADYDRLPSGTRYQAPDGSFKIKG